MTRFVYAFIAIIAALVTSCASGPQYTTVRNSLTPSKGKGLAVIYCQPGFAGGGAKEPLYVNDQLITHEFCRGGFYTHECKPGTNRFSTEPRKQPASVNGSVAQGALEGALIGAATLSPLNAAAGAVGGAFGGYYGAKHQVEYLQIEIKTDSIYFIEIYNIPDSNMRLQSRKEAEIGIEKCQWLNAPKM